MFTQLNKRTKWMAATAVLVLCLTTSSARAEDTDLYTKTLQATGWIYVPGCGDGTCWVVDRDQRLVVTNKHVVGTKDDAEIMFPIFQNGQLVTASSEYLKRAESLVIKGKVIARDGKRDLALVQLDYLPSNVGVLTLAESSAKLNDPVISIGNSGLAGKPIELGTLWKMRTGKVSNKFFLVLNYNNVNQKVESSMLNSDLHTSSGDSGGPVVNQNGELVGVTSGGDNMNSFAIDVTEVRAFLDRVLSSGRRTSVSSSLVAGTWTQTWTNSSGKRYFAGLTFRTDGTVIWEDDRGSFEGSYSIAEGRLTLVLPSLRYEMTAQVNWNGSDAFNITQNGISYTVERR